MGTHPIFESDFDCLTGFQTMKLFSLITCALSIPVFIPANQKDIENIRDPREEIYPELHRFGRQWSYNEPNRVINYHHDFPDRRFSGDAGLRIHGHDTENYLGHNDRATSRLALNHDYGNHRTTIDHRHNHNFPGHSTGISHEYRRDGWTYGATARMDNNGNPSVGASIGFRW